MYLFKKTTNVSADTVWDKWIPFCEEKYMRVVQTGTAKKFGDVLDR